MNWNEIRYRKAINTEQIYNISNNEFREWLIRNHYMDGFVESINRIESIHDYDSLYDLAWDYSVPIIIIKLCYYEIHS